LVKFICETLQQTVEEEFMASLCNIDNLSIEKYGIDEYKILTDMYQHMTVQQIASPEFPTQYMELMGKVVLIIINWYKTYPSLYQKIKVMCLLHESLFGDSSSTRNSRVEEIQELNDNFHAMSAEFNELREGELHAKLIKTDTPSMFHKDSQFMSVSIRAKLTEVQVVEKRAKEAEKRIQELEAKLHDIELRTKNVQFRESEVEKDKQKLEDELNSRETALAAREDALEERAKPSFLEESAFKTAAAKLGAQFVYDTLYAMEPPPEYTTNDPERIKKEGENYWFPDYYKKTEYSHVMSLIKGKAESGEFWTKMMSSNEEPDEK